MEGGQCYRTMVVGLTPEFTLTLAPLCRVLPHVLLKLDILGAAVFVHAIVLGEEFGFEEVSKVLLKGGVFGCELEFQRYADNPLSLDEAFA